MGILGILRRQFANRTLTVEIGGSVLDTQALIAAQLGYCSSD
jgi:hypothetical protein